MSDFTLDDAVANQSIPLGSRVGRIRDISSVYAGLGSLPQGSYEEVYTARQGRKKLNHFYRCNVEDCRYETRKSTTLVVHVRKHFDICPFTCAHCGK